MDICLANAVAIISIEKKQSRRKKKVAEEFSFYLKEKQTCFLESSDSAKHAVNVFEGEESYERTLEI